MTDLVAPSTGQRSPSPYPARSKMLDMYTGDIARMLAERQYQAAERAALAIPHMAVALADAGLQSSVLMYQEWCLHWVQPAFGPQAYTEWCMRSNECQHASGVPFASLRALRLQRRARELPSPMLNRNALVAESGSAQAITCALLDAACRWFEQEGRHQPVVQTNLARLGVLR